YTVSSDAIIGYYIQLTVTIAKRLFIVKLSLATTAIMCMLGVLLIYYQ
ncbi:unnamed protein product, partial [Didymodactylos carnosus]